MLVSLCESIRGALDLEVDLVGNYLDVSVYDTCSSISLSCKVEIDFRMVILTTTSTCNILNDKLPTGNSLLFFVSSALLRRHVSFEDASCELVHFRHLLVERNVFVEVL